MTRRGKHTKGCKKMAFMAQAGTLQADPVVPTRWAMLLAELGLSEEDALRQVSLQTTAGIKLRDFVRHRFTTVFVPEAVLRALDIRADELVMLRPRLTDEQRAAVGERSRESNRKRAEAKRRQRESAA